MGAGAISQLSRRAWIASAVISQGLIEIERRALHPDQWPGMTNPYISIASKEYRPIRFALALKRPGSYLGRMGQHHHHHLEQTGESLAGVAKLTLEKQGEKWTEIGRA